jgi:ABC-type sugar transport system substrate-binding protein
MMEMNRRAFLCQAGAGAVGLAGGGLLVGCGSNSGSGNAASGGSQKTKVVAFSHPTSQVPFVIALKKAVAEMGNEAGFKMVFDNDNGKIDAQSAAVDTWLSQRVDAITIFPLDPSAFTAQMKRAQSQGTKWSTYLLPMNGNDGNMTFPPKESGQLIADKVVSWIRANGNDAKVLILSASTIPLVMDRVNVPKRAIQQQTGARIVAEQDALDPATGQQVTEAVLQAHPDLNVVVGLNDDGALGAAKALKNAGKDPAKCFVCGQDGSKEALQAILDKNYYKASGALSVTGVSRAIVSMNQKIFAGAEDVSVHVPTTLATADDPSTVKRLLAEYAKYGG